VVDGLTNLVNTFDQRITDLQTLTGTMMSEYRSGIASSVALSGHHLFKSTFGEAIY
jgi:hypothetical protein